MLALFHAPVLGAALRLAANKLMRLNIFLATDWEQWILQVRIINVCVRAIPGVLVVPHLRVACFDFQRTDLDQDTNKLTLDLLVSLHCFVLSPPESDVRIL